MANLEVMKQALEVLEGLLDDSPPSPPILRILRQAIEQAEQEPVAWIHEWDDGERIPLLHNETRDNDKPVSVRPLIYGDTCPQPTAWVGLTDEEIREIIGPWGDAPIKGYTHNVPIKGYTRKLFDRIETKLKEKNT